MNTQSMLEQQVLSNVIELKTLQKAEPLPSTEEIREAWLQQRLGKFTASEFHRLLTYPNKAELPAGAMTYITEKAAERLTQCLQDNHFISPAMQWGLDYELEAIHTFQQQTGLTVTQTGSNQALLTLGDHIGGTPDGLIADDSGIEIKCPCSTTHFKYLGLESSSELKAAFPKYYWQVQGLLHITGRSNWYFVSYDPRYTCTQKQLHIIHIQPNGEDIAFLSSRLNQAVQVLNEYVTR